MKRFDQLPKSIKKTIRYISQDVETIEDLEQLENLLAVSIQKKKRQLLAEKQFHDNDNQN